ncbi:MAG: VPLPA-CTERM sorting domain-containing protein [Hyphomicrobiales bacterium]
MFNSNKGWHFMRTWKLGTSLSAAVVLSMGTAVGMAATAHAAPLTQDNCVGIQCLFPVTDPPPGTPPLVTVGPITPIDPLTNGVVLDPPTTTPPPLPTQILDGTLVFINITPPSVTPPGGGVNGNGAVIPIPAALPLFATGLAGLAYIGRRRKANAAG